MSERHRLSRETGVRGTPPLCFGLACHGTLVDRSRADREQETNVITSLGRLVRVLHLLKCATHQDSTGSLLSSTRQNGLQRPRTAGECNISRNHPRNGRILAEATALHVGARILAKDPSVRQRRPRGSVFGAAFCLRLLRFCRDRCMAVPGRIGLAPTTGSSCPSSRSSAKQTINHPCRATWLGVIIVQ